MTMKSISVSEAKAKLSQHLRLVSGGQTVTICDRGQPVAQLVPMTKAHSLDVTRLIASGALKPSTKKLPKDFWSTPRVADRKGSILSALLDERSDRI